MNCDEVWMWLQRELLTRTEKNPSRMHRADCRDVVDQFQCGCSDDGRQTPGAYREKARAEGWAATGDCTANVDSQA